MRAASEWVWARDGFPQRRSRIAMLHNFVERANAVTFNKTWPIIPIYCGDRPKQVRNG